MCHCKRQGLYRFSMNYQTCASSSCCGVMVTTLFTPAVVSMPVCAVEDDDGEVGAVGGGLRLARMMLLP